MKTKNKTAISTLIAVTIAVSILVAFSATASADATPDHYVDPAGGNTHPYDTWATAAQSIQDAIDAAGSGDTVHVAAGTYYETAIFRSDDHHIHLVGKDGAIIRDKPDGSLLYGIDLKGGTHDISISGFEIWGFDEKDDAGIAGWTNPGDPDFTAMSYITIHHNDIHDNYDGINIGAFVWATWSPPSWRHNHITIQHNEIYENCYRGIDLWSVSESTIAHNEILDNGGDWNANGIPGEDADDMNKNGVPDGDGMTWVYVSDSTATHNTISGSYEVGLSMNQATGNTVTHNDVTDNLNLGIALFGWGAPTTDNTFVHNDARDNISLDILCYQKWGSLVYGNKWIKNKYVDADPDPPV